MASHQGHCLLLAFFLHHHNVDVQLHHLPLFHSLVFLTDFLSFLLLYPATFNLLEISAVQSPKLHLYDTGVMRITRHPQSVGQVMWCFAHAAWIGTDVVVSASLILIAHHMFSVWNGDRRLQDRYGESFLEVKARTSVVPFLAILEGRQVLPEGYWREWARAPYVAVVAGTTAAYFAHPWMMAGASLLGW